MAKKTRFDRFLTAANSMRFTAKAKRFEEASLVLKALQREVKKKSDKAILQDLQLALMLGR